MKTYFRLILAFCLFNSCSNHNGALAIFKKLSPHDRYAQQLADAGLGNTALGREWQEKAAMVLASPLTVAVPYRENGYFAAEKVNAAALAFAAKRGQKIDVRIDRKPVSFIIYADLFLDGKLVSSTDSAGLVYEVKQNGNYVLRFQPELLNSGEYSLGISAGPVLGFPVSASGHPKIEGFWGDGRDDNSRKHEGIDIFTPKGTPALAAANGTIVNVGENKLGGLVVMMQPNGANYTLYYAHLGVQMVRGGQQVKLGDTIGLIDNTGNAKNTPSHLHFGIYTSAGAIDPLFFVKQTSSITPKIIAPLNKFNTMAIVRGIPVNVLAATANDYRITYPDNKTAFVSAASVEPLRKSKRRLNAERTIYDRPDTNAARMGKIPQGAEASLNGQFKNYQMVTYQNKTGWIIDK